MGIEARDSCDFDMSVNFQAAADFIHRALSRGGEKSLNQRHSGNESKNDSNVILRQGAGSLSRWREPVRHPGPGLPDAEAAPDPGGGDLCCEAELWCYSQPRIPATAHQT